MKHVPERLHNKMLDLIHRQSRLLRDSLKTHRPIIRVPLKHRLNKRHETNLLLEEGVVFLEDWLYTSEISPSR